MRLADLQYDLPPGFIAQYPAEPRDSSRLLVLDRSSGRIEHRIFWDLPEYLRFGDCLVLNDTRVIPARFFCRRASGGRVEGLFLHEQGRSWRVMLKPAARLRTGQRLACEGSTVSLVVGERLDRGEWLVRPEPPVLPLEWLGQVGRTPLPPYIRRGVNGGGDVEPLGSERYQTVYAERPGAVAAPTAGLHFTPRLLDRITRLGVRQAKVTLHVGSGTFVPIEVEDLAQHRMHAEWLEVGSAAIEVLGLTRRAGGRIVAVGTTSVRVLESLPTLKADGTFGTDARLLWEAKGAASGRLGRDPAGSLSGWTDVFIYPPYDFRNVDRLVTNFHLPGSTLLALVMAFAGPELIRRAYREAIDQRYRFYSYGDAMLIL